MGILLDANDFLDEQTYHRGQLARTLVHLHGSGTAAGLKVIWEAGKTDSQPSQEEQLKVEPGIAVDRLGRLIEIPRPACIRLQRWFDGQVSQDNGSNVMQAIHDITPDGASESVKAVVADLFVRFVVCERGKTPAFATGPYDALDAVEPSRLRDGYELELFLRKEHPLPFPEKRWPTDKGALQEAIFQAWHRATDRQETPGHAQEHQLLPLAEHLHGQDPTFVLLARIAIPVMQTEGDPKPVRTGSSVIMNNHIRPFVFTTGVLARMLGIDV
jgi:hypothetical protein